MWRIHCLFSLPMPATGRVFGRRPRAHPLRRILAFVVGIVVCGAILVMAWIALGLPPQISARLAQPSTRLAVATLVFALVLFVSWVCTRRLELASLAQIGLGRARGWGRALALGTVAGSVTPFAVFAILWSLGYAHVARVALTTRYLATQTVPTVLAIALSSTAQEIAVRGYVLQVLAAWRGPVLASVATGLAFGLQHAANPGANLGGLLYTALNGALLGLLVLRTRSLWIAIGYHAAWNLAAAILLGLRDSGNIEAGALLHTRLDGPRLLTGGSYGFEASILTGAIELAVLLLLLWRSPVVERRATARAAYSTSGARDFPDTGSPFAR